MDSFFIIYFSHYSYKHSLASNNAEAIIIIILIFIFFQYFRIITDKEIHAMMLIIQRL